MMTVSDPTKKIASKQIKTTHGEENSLKKFSVFFILFGPMALTLTPISQIHWVFKD